MPNYIWENRYEAALFATDPFLLKMYIKNTREMMVKRLKVLDIRESPAATREYDAIQNAEAKLKVLERDLNTEASSSARDASR